MNFPQSINYIITSPKAIILIVLNIFFVMALWHMDVNHVMAEDGKKRTRGFFHFGPERAYRTSQYALIALVILVDLVGLFL